MNNFSSIISVVLFSVLLIITSCTDEAQVADLVIINGDIYSEDKMVYQAIACENDKITALGSNIEIEKYIGNKTTVIDAAGHFVSPGLIEGHGHFSGLGEFLMNLNFLRAKSWDEIVSMVEAKVKESEPGEWIIGRGWHQEKWSEPVHDHVHGYPKHFDLSKISPDNPVMLDHASGHGIFVNKKAMDMAGISSEMPDPTGGRIVRDENGQPIGVFEENAENIIKKFYSEYLAGLSQKEQIDLWYKGIELAQDECFKKGITSFQDAGAHFDEILRYRDMAEKDQLRIRLWSMLRESSEEMGADVSKYRVINAGDNKFTCRAIKTELDGALGSFGAWLMEPYADKADFYGQNTTTLEEVSKIAQIAHDNEMQLCVHAIGDKANHETLNIIEKYTNQSQKVDLRWRIEHSQHLHPNDIPRFAQLNTIASMQGIHCTSDAPFVEKRLGYERAKHGAYNWRGLLDNGAIIANGTDAPVEDVDPLESFYASVTRKRADNGFEFFPENKMSREEALISYTSSNAYAAFEEDIKGSIAIGKLADFTILSNNLLTCKDEEILDTEVLYTIVGSKIMYQKE